MTNRDAVLMVGGPLHGQHYSPRIDTTRTSAFKVAHFDAIFMETSAPGDAVQTSTHVYHRRRLRATGGLRGEAWATPNSSNGELFDAVRLRGLPNTVSVLLPSRGRIQPLAESITSLHQKATDPSRIEILVASDPDDPGTAAACLDSGIYCWQAPERYGYSRLNEYFNALDSKAGGEWTLLWNDDARMLTDGWDEVLYNTPDEVMIADLWVDGHSPDLCTFPAVRRHLITKTGGVFSPWTCHCDTWWQDVGRQLQVIRPVEIKVDHQRSDLQPGKHADLTRQEALSGYRQADFYGATVQGNLYAAVERAALALSQEKR